MSPLPSSPGSLSLPSSPVPLLAHSSPFPNAALWGALDQPTPPLGVQHRPGTKWVLVRVCGLVVGQLSQ